MSAWKDTVETLLRERGPALFGYAYVLTGDPNVAEDLLHDAVIRTFKRGRGTYGVDQAHIYVKRAIFTTFVDGRRRAAARPQASSRSVEVSTDPTAAVDASMAVHEAILTLTPQQRACVVLRYLDDLPVAAVATELGLATGTVKRYVSDAMASLRRTHPELSELLEDTSHHPTITVTVQERS